MGGVQIALAILGAVGGLSGAAAVVSALSQRKIAPRDVRNDETEAALLAMGSAIDRLEAELARVKGEHVVTVERLEGELVRVRADNDRLRARVGELEQRRNP